jgi:hypothetical protein
VLAELVWGTTGGTGNSVQFALSGNSPVALSQIAALSVDNSRCSADVQFLFPDAGFTLDTAARSLGVYPVFTNALTFYAVSPKAALGDVTVFQVLNSLPYPMTAQLPADQAASISGALAINTNATTPLITGNGTLTAASLVASLINATASTESAALLIQDGTGKNLWSTWLVCPANTSQNVSIPISGARLKFINGLSLVVSSSTFSAGSMLSLSLYYTVP